MVEACLHNRKQNRKIPSKRPSFLKDLYSLQQRSIMTQVDRTILCPPSDYQTHLSSLVMQGLQDAGKKRQPQVRSVTNSVMELRNISNHPFLVGAQRSSAFLCGALSARIQLKARSHSISHKTC